MHRKTLLLLALALSLVIALIAIAANEEIRERLGPTYWIVSLAITGCVLLVLAGYVWDRSLVQRLQSLNLAADQRAAGSPEKNRDDRIDLARNIEQMAHELQKTEASYRAVVEDQDELICRYRADGKLTFVNGAYTRFFGRKRADLVGQPFPLFHLALAAREQPGAHGETTSYESVLEQAPGKSLCFLWTQRAIRGAQGEVLEYQAVGHDLTPQKEAEAALLRAKNAAEAADRSKSEFLAMVTHEIRTPINGVLGFANLLRETPLTPDQREQVDLIRTSAEVLESLIADILDLSRMEAGKLDLDHQPFGLHKCVTDTCAFFGPKAKAAALTIETHFDANVPAIVNGDQLRLRQVLANLIGNAIKFTDQGGVVLKVSCVKNELPPVGNNPTVRVFFAISDTGIGIPPEKLDRLFKPFSQLDTSATRRRGGTGLGLIISKRLCELMGGAISVESKPNQGSTFRFSIMVDYDRADTTTPFLLPDRSTKG
jgi:PAS domain S-box-containing protein